MHSLISCYYRYISFLFYHALRHKTLIQLKKHASNNRVWDTVSSHSRSVLINWQFPGHMSYYNASFKHEVKNVLKRASIEWVFNGPWFKEARSSAWSTTYSGTAYLVFYSLFHIWSLDSFSMFSFETYCVLFYIITETVLELRQISSW